MLRKGCANTYLRPVSYFFLFLTILVTMVSYCTSSWYSTVEIYFDEESKLNTVHTLHKGIWKVCENQPDWLGKCFFLPDDDNTQKFDLSSGTLTSVRALYSMAIMLMLGAQCYPPFYKNMSNGVLKIGIMSILTAVGGTCTFVSLLIMTHALHTSLDEIPRFGYSYIAGWVSAGMSFFTASLLYIASKDNVYVEGIY